MIPRKIIVAGLLGILALSLYGFPGHGAGIEEKKVAFQTIEQGFRSGVRSEKTIAVRDAGVWEQIWMEHRTGSSQDAVPTVDFGREMVIAIFLGSRPTGGYSVSIKEIALSDDGALKVAYQEGRPGKDCMVIQALTEPFHMVRCRLSKGSVTFTRSVIASDCSAR